MFIDDILLVVFVQICAQRSDRLNNLGTVMSLYSRGTFGKDSFQWTKCVVKYVLDVYGTASLSMISFLVEVGQKSYVTQKLMSLSKNFLVIFIRDLYIKTAFTQHICWPVS